jgi:hypothetical protein
MLQELFVVTNEDLPALGTSIPRTEELLNHKLHDEFFVGL